MRRFGFLAAVLLTLGASLVPRAAVRPLAPDFTLRDQSGTPIHLAAHKGHVVLINFWATWCGDCNVEVPWFSDFQARYAAKGLDVIGVSLDDTWTPIPPAMARWHMNYRVVLGDEPVRRAYNVTALPITVLIDREGRIADSHRGLVNRGQAETLIRQLLGP